MGFQARDPTKDPWGCLLGGLLGKKPAGWSGRRLMGGTGRRRGGRGGDAWFDEMPDIYCAARICIGNVGLGERIN